MSKPKLTEEQVKEIFGLARDYSPNNFIDMMVKRGYYEYPETKLEKAERLYKKWENEYNDGTKELGWSNTVAVVKSLWEAIEEIKKG